MIKDDLVKRIATGFDFSLALSGEIVQAVLDEITTGLVEGSRIELRRFGVFGIKRQKPRVITLPSGQKIKRPVQNVVTFTPSTVIKKKINPARRQRK